ncbi:MAG: family 20 glycosylhydrolase [Clostridia bacterium]|nr:family 20 glycosylhydrolase [Clostridia bacterium]
MFFKPQIWKKGAPCAIAATCVIEGAEGYALEVLQKVIDTFGTAEGTIQTIKVCNELPADFSLNNQEEGYTLEIGEDTAVLCGGTLRARIYAAVTLQQMLDHNELCQGTLQDAPDCGFRGYRTLLPSSITINDYKKTVDLLAYYKYNCLSFEIGGAMELKNHPEINETWKKFVHSFYDPDDPFQTVNNALPWRKDANHPNNADCLVVTQEEVKEFIAYARERGLEVYPEVPSLSHCEYLCMAHPEIAERQNDPYPDAYCPNHPDTYKLLFEMLQEIIDVFQPKVVNIGHDELYSIGLCERCKGTPPHELFVRDVTTIYEWLKERGIRTMMWADKLLPIILSDGRHYGGAGGEFIRMRGGKPRQYEDMPVLYYCQSMLPRDIVMLHWYGGFGIQYDYVYHTHGYNATVFGNMALGALKNWRQRRELGIKGGAPSNWGTFQEVYMQRNCQYYNLIAASFALWSKEYDDPMLDEVSKATFHECFRVKFGDLSKVPHIKICHTTDQLIPYRTFYNGVYANDTYHMGKYRVSYTDGTEEFFDITYGENITNCDYPYQFDLIDKNDFDEDNLSVAAIAEVSCSTIPETINGKTYYNMVWINPHPEKEIASVDYISESDAKVEIHKIEY